MNSKLIIIILIVVGLALTGGLGYWYFQVYLEPNGVPAPGSAPPANIPGPQAPSQQKSAAVQSGATPSPYEGALLRTMQNGEDKGKVFIVYNGLKQWIMSEGTLNKAGGWNAVQDVTKSVIDSIPSGPAIA